MPLRCQLAITGLFCKHSALTCYNRQDRAACSQIAYQSPSRLVDLANILFSNRLLASLPDSYDDAHGRRQFASNPSIVGSDIDLNGMPATVVGVLPASFDLDAIFSPGTKADLFEPAILEHMRTLGGIATMIGRR